MQNQAIAQIQTEFQSMRSVCFPSGRRGQVFQRAQIDKIRDRLRGGDSRNSRTQRPGGIPSGIR